MRPLVISILLVLSSSALAVQPDELLSDPVLEARARLISRDIRCVVCQSENIDDSNAPLARDLRLLIRERLVAGDENHEVVAFLVERYGDYVLLKPPVQMNTIALWAAPVAAAAAGAIGFWSVMRSGGLRGDGPKPLTTETGDSLHQID